MTGFAARKSEYYNLGCRSGMNPIGENNSRRDSVMAMLEEKQIRGYQLKNRTYVCPVCATDEEKADSETTVMAEDAIHDSKPMECVRCKKVVK
jgi:hypothetical protein